jgi:transposase
MNTNTSISIGNIALLDKIDGEFNFFGSVLDGLTGKTKHFKQSVKLLLSNRLGKCVSINRLSSLYKPEFFELLGFKESPKERTIARDLERVGEKSQFIVNQYQKLLFDKKLVSSTQFIDWSSSSLEGNKTDLAQFGYSRDKRPDKKQITWGISTGINGIPTAFTIQKGNVVDKKHFKSMLKTVEKVLEPCSFLVFDCGANTKENKKDILNRGYNYLTLKQKQKGPYKKYLEIYKKSKKDVFILNGLRYKCVKINEEGDLKYIYFCKKAYKNQKFKNNQRFKKELKKNDKILKKVKKEKEIARILSREGEISLRGELNRKEVINPHKTGLEGFFILESSVDLESSQILKVYKDRDRAEKLIRDMKEGTELRPIRHFSKKAIIGYLTIVFLTNCIIQLTHFLTKNSDVKNLKLLRKYLNSLTVTIVYNKSLFKFRVLSNILPEIEAILGTSIEKYEDKTLKLRW